MPKILTVLFFGLIFEAIGVVYLSKGLKELGDVPKNSVAEMLVVVWLGVTNKNIVLGVAFEALFFAALLYLLTKGDVSFVWPLTSLSFVVTTLAAKYFLQEQVPGIRWAGVALIMCGAALITYSEKQQIRNIEAKVHLEEPSKPD
jgi:uncharacterized membrane protein